MRFNKSSLPGLKLEGRTMIVRVLRQYFQLSNCVGLAARNTVETSSLLGIEV